MNLKSKLKRRELAIGSWITIGDTSIAEIMAKAGFDWLAVDMEHSAITLDRAQELIRIIELSGISPLVRVEKNDSSIIKRVMDIGAHGVIVPMVNTEEDALEAVRSVKYPPDGHRGVGLARAQGYGTEFERYKKWLASKSIVICQIEHIDGVENLEKILSVNGVDAFFVGPYDLSASLGYPGEFQHPKVQAAFERIKKISANLGVSAGFHVVQPDTALLEEKIREGYTFLAFCFDALFLATMCRDLLSNIKRGHRKAKK